MYVCVCVLHVLRSVCVCVRVPPSWTSIGRPPVAGERPHLQGQTRRVAEPALLPRWPAGVKFVPGGVRDGVAHARSQRGPGRARRTQAPQGRSRCLDARPAGGRQLLVFGVAAGAVARRAGAVVAAGAVAVAGLAGVGPLNGRLCADSPVQRDTCTHTDTSESPRLLALRPFDAGRQDSHTRAQPRMAQTPAARAMPRRSPFIDALARPSGRCARESAAAFHGRRFKAAMAAVYMIAQVCGAQAMTQGEDDEPPTTVTQSS